MTKKEARSFAKVHLLRLLSQKQLVQTVCDQLETTLKSQKPQAILSYKNDPFEIDPTPVLESLSIPIFYPKIVGEGLVFLKPESWAIGPYKIPEPVGKEQILWEEADVCILPSLGINAHGIRLGRGGGFYDKTLANRKKKNSKTPLVLGLGFSELMPLDFEGEAHDQNFSLWLVENKAYYF